MRREIPAEQPPNVSRQALTVATRLVTLIAARHPDSPLRRGARRLRASTALRWAATLEAKVVAGSMTWAEIESVMRWAQGDEQWRHRIAGVDNMLDHWTELLEFRQPRSQARE